MRARFILHLIYEGNLYAEYDVSRGVVRVLYVPHYHPKYGYEMCIAEIRSEKPENYGQFLLKHSKLLCKRIDEFENYLESEGY